MAGYAETVPQLETRDEPRGANAVLATDEEIDDDQPSR